MNYELTIITTPNFWQGEAEVIKTMFRSGLVRLHLRKPDSSLSEYRALLEQIPQCYHKQIVLHDHFELVDEFGIGGLHLNRRNPQPPEGWDGGISTSCHSIEELREKHSAHDSAMHYDYLTLSPIYESVSKPGYVPSFTHADLDGAYREGIIDDKVFALGGITRFNAREAVETLHFGGTLTLGDAWHVDDMPVVLSVAGSDSSAGAGIQQDLKTCTNLGCYGATAITAVTSQNTLGVQGVEAVSGAAVESQMQSVLSDLRVAALKIGMIPNREVAEAIVRCIKRQRQYQVLPVVYDPIMISTSGTPLMDEGSMQYVTENLFPLCTLITPNIPEYEYLSACPSASVLFGRPLLVKGGHAEGSAMTDTLRLPDEGCEFSFTSPSISTRNLHGTGCTLSSAIACGIAKGKSLPDAVREAKDYIDKAIVGGRDLHIGHGNGPLWYVP